MRSPIGIYRAGLGFLFGRRLLMLEHVGRSSGAARYVVLEVVTQLDKNTVVIASALGTTAQWFQNLLADPQCHVSTGARHRVPATASVMSRAAADHALAEYQAKHPALWGKLHTLITNLHPDEPKFELPLVKLSMMSD